MSEPGDRDQEEEPAELFRVAEKGRHVNVVEGRK